MPPTRFIIGTTIDGYEVLDSTDGRPVTDSFITANKPLEVAANLNDAVEADASDPDSHGLNLRVALGCIEPNDDFDADLWIEALGING